MLDQASQLRMLALRSMRQAALEGGPAPRLVTVTGGQAGVGATTLAVNLAVAAAQQGARVVLVDADLGTPNRSVGEGNCRARLSVSDLCGLTSAESVADVLAVRRDIHEILQLGPAGIQVACGAAAQNSLALGSEAAQERLIRQLQALGRHADLVLVDVGHSRDDVVRRSWAVADAMVVVTTPDQVAVMETYATLKAVLPGSGIRENSAGERAEILANSAASPSLGLVVNRASSAAQVADVHARLDLSCRRFLAREVRLLGAMAPDQRVPLAAQAGVPLVIGSPRSVTCAEIERIAAFLVASQRDSLTKPTTTAA